MHKMRKVEEEEYEGKERFSKNGTQATLFTVDESRKKGTEAFGTTAEYQRIAVDGPS